MRLNIIPTERKCPMCFKKMKLHLGKSELFYCPRPCNFKVTLQHNTVLQNSRVYYKTFIIFFIIFYKETITKNLMRNLKISKNTVIDLKRIIKYKIMNYNKNTMLEDQMSL
ncbi:hypothetical protein DMUE_5894 [Dictyocoela muelleri]|nr:hypothetical protein DMUE_5894 [Dictyocoela muelleri]